MSHQDREDDESDSPRVLAAEIPTAVGKALCEQGGEIRRLTLAIKSDLSPEGGFGEQWLLIDVDHLWVISHGDAQAAVYRSPLGGIQHYRRMRADHQATVRYRASLDEISKARVERCVGNSLIQVTVRDQPRVLLHFTNGLTESFGVVAQYLTRRAQEGPDVEIPDPNKQGARCLRCGRRLVDPSSKICPNCMEKGKILRRLMDMARPYWGKMGLISLCIREASMI